MTYLGWLLAAFPPEWVWSCKEKERTVPGFDLRNGSVQKFCGEVPHGLLAPIFDLLSHLLFRRGVVHENSHCVALDEKTTSMNGRVGLVTCEFHGRDRQCIEPTTDSDLHDADQAHLVWVELVHDFTLQRKHRTTSGKSKTRAQRHG
jgi:hypothetical protein